jgi:hypothetical protein
MVQKIHICWVLSISDHDTIGSVCIAHNRDDGRIATWPSGDILHMVVVGRVEHLILQVFSETGDASVSTSIDAYSQSVSAVCDC